MLTDFTYKIVKSKRKTLVVEIKPDKTVTVRSPKSCSDTVISAFVQSKTAWINKHLSTMPEPVPALPEREIKALRERAKEYLPIRVKYWSEITGLIPSALKITSAKRRFGSCSGKNSVCLSLYLMQYPEYAIDYVIVHELCHIRHKNHSPVFHNLVKKYLPDADERIKLLKGK